MDDRAIPGPSRRRIGPLAVLVPLAFLVGVLLAAYLIRTRYWFGMVATSQPTAAQPAAPLPSPAEPPMNADAAALSARTTAIAAQLAALEARVRGTSGDAAASGAQAGRAEAMLVLAASRRALDRGQPLGFLDGALAQRFPGQRDAVEIIRVAARAPVLLEDLRAGLSTLASDAGTPGEDWRATFSRQIGNLIVLRHADVPTPPLADRLATAQRLVDAGRVDAARAQVGEMAVPGAAGWTASAGRYVAAHQALDTLERVALTAPQAPAR